MERLLIFLAVLVLIAAGAMVFAMAARGRRPPLHMDSEFHEDDTDILVGPVGRTRGSPIDRSAEVLDAAPPGHDEATPSRPSPGAPR
ncbi:hypothetical protein [Methylobacterium persicinum]|uniref:Uncharacterized protein n=1 Tax=Methylobacterium persicinum TaxID=374426 RepID=A0ABU0HEU2_9HYPH|nr:hypothetical protein [Methylobacterium persicinum]MDQ0440838.1 hypothetical protein [Methylobacterium persicinum]GJE36735.1 hypothetical protein KHHGKMAE_0786 [Methylobacterium persicinum]